VRKPKRKINRLTEYDYAQNGAYFITICTHERQRILWGNDTFTGAENVGASIARPQRPPALSKAGKVVEQCIWEIPKQYPHISLEKYAIMPNHVHLLLLIQNGPGGRPMVAPTISTVIQQFKGVVSKRLSRPIWQKSFHDHVVRTEHGYAQIWQYIDTNPQLWHKDCFYEEPPHEP
jgi:putative transposase